MNIVKDKQKCSDQLLIVEKYERVIAYLYPIIQRAPRKQSVTRAKRAIKALQLRKDIEGLNRFLAAWTGHASWADTNRLFASLEIAQ